MTNPAHHSPTSLASGSAAVRMVSTNSRVIVQLTGCGPVFKMSAGRVTSIYVRLCCHFFYLCGFDKTIIREWT